MVEASMQPAIIIGAGRSGTNALRDALCGLNALSTWPCDEINYIWRSGNRDYPTDELLPSHAAAASPLVRRAFERRTRKDPEAIVVEKTCANSLRVGFVHAVLPGARLIVITRDPIDVVASAAKRWSAPLELGYIARKARFVPPRDLPHYALRYGRTRLYRNRSAESRLSSWGPRFEGMDELSQSDISVAELAAHQWKRCTDLCEEQLLEVPEEQVHRLKYEDLVTEPTSEVQKVVQFLGLDVPKQEIRAATAAIHPGSIGKGSEELGPEAIHAVRSITSTDR